MLREEKFEEIFRNRWARKTNLRHLGSDHACQEGSSGFHASLLSMESQGISCISIGLIFLAVWKGRIMRIASRAECVSLFSVRVIMDGSVWSIRNITIVGLKDNIIVNS